MSRIFRTVSEQRVVLDTLRLSDDAWYECVSEMDRKAATSKHGIERRADERVPYRNSSRVMIQTTTYDDREQYFKVRPYDLSRSGMGFLNGAYMHVGTEVILHLRHRDAGIIRVPATIRQCVHIKNTIHLVGAQFDEPIVVDDFLLAASG